MLLARAAPNHCFCHLSLEVALLLCVRCISIAWVCHRICVKIYRYIWLKFNFHQILLKLFEILWKFLQKFWDCKCGKWKTFTVKISGSFFGSFFLEVFTIRCAFILWLRAMGFWVWWFWTWSIYIYRHRGMHSKNTVTQLLLHLKPFQFL